MSRRWLRWSCSCIEKHKISSFIPLSQGRGGPCLLGNLDDSFYYSKVSYVSNVDFTFHNWANTFAVKPDHYHAPSTEAEIAEIARHAHRHRHHLKVVGNGHSPNAICIEKRGTTHIVDLRPRMNRVVAVDRARAQVRFQAGALIGDLNRELFERHTLAFSCLPSVGDMTFAGAIATGTHSTGARFHSLGEYVTSLRLVTGTGEIVECSRERRPEIFRAAQCSLGALGIVTELTVQCEPAFRLHVSEVPASLEEVLGSLPEIIEGAEHARFWWFPHTEMCMVWKANRTTRLATPARAYSKFVTGDLYQALLYAATRVPPLTALINRVYRGYRHGRADSFVAQSHEVFHFDCLFPQYVIEYAIPIEHTAEAVRRLRAAIESDGIYVNFPIEIRFAAADDAYLSPAYGRRTCWINILMYRPYLHDHPHRERYFRRYEEIMISLAGRPHWAKEFAFERREQFARIYPELSAFERVREELDPLGIFQNRTTGRLLV